MPHVHRSFIAVVVGAILAIGPAQAQPNPEPATVRIAVLTLFHPKTLAVTLPHPTAVTLDGRRQTLTTITLTYPQTLAVPDGAVTLGIPGKLTRTYRGALTVVPHKGSLLPVLTLDTELAVASIVAAESPPGAPFEALKAQAIASRMRNAIRRLPGSG